MEFSFCMNTHMSIVSIQAKNQRSRFFHFPVINNCNFFKSETCFSGGMDKKQNGEDCPKT